MMILWDDAFEPPTRPADPTPAVPPRAPVPDDPNDDPEQDRQPPGRIWHVPRYAIPEELGRRSLLAFLAVSLGWLITVALYLR
jgi:hypothetical protein